jgi:hypothetical protein
MKVVNLPPASTRLADNLGENRFLKRLELDHKTLRDEEISGGPVRSLILAFPRLKHMYLSGNHITRQGGLQAFASPIQRKLVEMHMDLRGLLG